MIPWVREKIAERRIKWKTRNDPTNTGTSSSLQNSPSHRDDHRQSSTSKFRSSISSTESKRDSEQQPKDKIKIRILSQNARVIILQTATNKKLLDLKHEALIEFAEDSAALPLFASDVRQLIPKYRFVRPDNENGQNLNENLTIAQLNINDNETLMLNVRRTNTAIYRLRPLTEIHGPGTDEIEAATRNIPNQETPARRVNINDLVMQSDIQFDVRKVLISLALESAYVIGVGPYASRLILMLKQKLINKRNHQSDTLQCLVDMGFPRDKALHALKVRNGVYSSALEWLIEHQSETLVQSYDSNSVIAKVPSNLSQTNSSVENIEALLKIIRIYSHRETLPSQDVINNLKEMGFCEPEVLDALKHTHNNQSAACEWLCGNRSSSLMELREGLSPESPILKAMMESPEVQISLGNPKVFIAYLSMLENQNALSMWLGDSDTSSVISHILRKYHEEKHILGINQFNATSFR